MATQIYSDNLIVIKTLHAISPERTKRLHDDLIQMRKSGVMVIPAYCQVVYIEKPEKETECQQS